MDAHIQQQLDSLRSLTPDELLFEHKKKGSTDKWCAVTYASEVSSIKCSNEHVAIKFHATYESIEEMQRIVSKKIQDIPTPPHLFGLEMHKWSLMPPSAEWFALSDEERNGVLFDLLREYRKHLILEKMRFKQRSDDLKNNKVGLYDDLDIEQSATAEDTAKVASADAGNAVPSSDGAGAQLAENIGNNYLNEFFQNSRDDSCAFAYLDCSKFTKNIQNCPKKLFLVMLIGVGTKDHCEEVTKDAKKDWNFKNFDIIGASMNKWLWFPPDTSGVHKVYENQQQTDFLNPKNAVPDALLQTLENDVEGVTV